MRGTFSPISQQYSEELGQLLLSMLHLDPIRRPSINQIMAQPIVLNALMNLYTDVGAIPCRRSVDYRRQPDPCIYVQFRASEIDWLFIELFSIKLLSH